MSRVDGSLFEDGDWSEDFRPRKTHGSMPKPHVRDFPFPYEFLNHPHGGQMQSETQFREDCVGECRSKVQRAITRKTIDVLKNGRVPVCAYGHGS